MFQQKVTAKTGMLEAVKTHNWGAKEWTPVTSFQGAVLQQAGWPKFSASGDIVEYTEFKKQWHKIDKTGVGDKKLLKIMC
jgi:hypothetical protein